MSNLLTMGPVDEGFLLSEASGFRSRDAVTLKSGSVYKSGSVVIAEFTESVAGSGNFNVRTGKHVLATAALLAAYSTDEAVIVARRVDATAADKAAGVIARDAEVKDSELTVGAATTVADVEAALAARGIIVREAI